MNPSVSSDIKLPGQSNKARLAAIILGVLFILALAFGLWAFSSKQTLKSQADKKLATANATLAQATAAEAAAKATNDKPYKTYTSSATNGSISFNYPKGWSSYVDETGSSQLIDGYFYPGQVPGIQGSTAFALRVEVVSEDYANIISQLQSDAQGGTLTASAFLPAKLKGIANAAVGTRFDGAINQDSSGNPQNGAMVVLKVRDKTLKVYTESNNYVSDFNNIVLPSLSYNP